MPTDLPLGLLTLAILLTLAACSSQDPPERADPTAGPVDRTVEYDGGRAPDSPPAQSEGRIHERREQALESVIVTGALQSSDTRHGSAPPSGSHHRRGPPANRENYRHVDDNPVRLTAEAPVSTFSIDVDTAAYSNVRRLLSRGTLPPAAAVRIEELVNYFGYDYPAPTGDAAFSVVTEVAPAPWAPERRLLHIGIQGRQVAEHALPPANLVFLIDVSGSMQSPAKLDLLKASMKLLLGRLDATDRVAIAVYAGSAGAVLQPTPGDQRGTIEAAIDRLDAGGSTNGSAGIHLAYALARQSFVDGGINRVILATDGDFNVGTTDQHALEDLVSRQRESGVALTVLGFGAGNYNDALMQRLAQAGNGNAAYVDTMNEARKVLVDELTSTLAIIAKDVKIQVEFNPAVVSEYQLIGYETRQLEREDFNNDRVDAGEIGAGHTVTAIYELTLAGGGSRRIDPLRYGGGRAPEAIGHDGELAFVRLRHKAPDGDTGTLLERPVYRADVHDDLSAASSDFRFAAAVAGFGALLRGGETLAAFTYDDVQTLASAARGDDPFGYRSEFLGLVRTAQALAGPAVSQR